MYGTENNLLNAKLKKKQLNVLKAVFSVKAQVHSEESRKISISERNCTKIIK